MDKVTECRDKLRKISAGIEMCLAFILVGIIAMSIFVQVLTRYVFKMSVSWLEELARFTFVWAALFGASIAYRKDALHRFTIASESLPPQAARLSSLLIKALMLFLQSVLIVYGLKLALFTYDQYSPALFIRMTVVYLAVPFSAGLMFIYTVIDIAGMFTKGGEA